MNYSTKDKIKDLTWKILEDNQSVFFKNAPGETWSPKLVEVLYTDDPKFGDYSLNLAMKLAKKMKKSSQEVAGEIVGLLEADQKFGGVVEKVEIAGPGFINLYLSTSYLTEQLKIILESKSDYGISEQGNGTKVHIDFVSANPTGPVTLGNARGIYGDSYGRVLEKNGYEVWREYYVNDFGNQLKKLGHSVLKDDEAQYSGKYIDELHKEIKGDDPVKVGTEAAKKILENMIKPTMKKMGIKFDDFYSEKSLHDSGRVMEVIYELKEQGLVYENEKAWWFKATDYGDEQDRVVIKSDGNVTYFGADISYHLSKFERGFDLALDIWGADHHGDVARVEGAMEAFGYREKLKIILTQFIRVIEGGKEVKMSKRQGTYITIDDLIDEVGLDAVRFYFLMYSTNKHIDFDMDLAKEKSEKNPVYYVQYAYARICSILRKSEKENHIENVDVIHELPLRENILTSSYEISLIKRLIRFPEIVSDIPNNFQVHDLCYYAIDLAKKFHQFYKNCRVLSENENETRARIALVMAVKNVLGEVFDLLGVEKREKM